MIAKINELKSTTKITEVKSLCETTIAAMSSVIYNNVTPEARFEIERVAVENLFEGLSSYKNKNISEWLHNQKRLYGVKNIGVRNAINVLKASDAKHDQALQTVLEGFEDKLNQYPEVLIYEEFISALSGDYNYAPGVTTQLDAVKSRVNAYKADIDITKIIETMKATRSNYLLPLIEDVVNMYVANKTEQTKSHLKETLVKFSYDPFVRDIINIVMLDATDLQLEYANGESSIEKIYSPLMYLGENEVAFNIKGSFYIRKGNNVNKIKKSDISKLDEKFLNLCEAVNVPNIEFAKNKIKVYVGDDKAIVTENSVIVNETEMTDQQFKDAAEVSQWVGNTNFFMLTESLKTNFNDIVEIDFAKRVFLKEDEGHSAHVIKLRDNIFITTLDPTNNKSTFYRNINPIQAEKIMMEHMNFNVSETFKDILPNKDRILSQIDETKASYVEYIQTLNEKIENFNSQEKTDVTKEVLVALQEELRDVKSEYKDYVNEIEKYTKVAEGVTVSIDVDGEKYTVPIPQSTSTAKGEEADNTAGTVIGAEHMEPSPASEITFDDSQTELLGDSPTLADDQVDLGVDNVEAEADAAEAGALDDAEPGEGEEGADDIADDESVTGEEGESEEGGDDDLDLGLGDEEETDEDEVQDYDEKKDIGEDEETELDPVADDISDTEPAEELGPGEEPDGELMKSGLDDGGEEADGEVKDAEVVTVEEKPKPKVFFVKAKATNESKSIKKKVKKLNEAVQIGDTVKYKNQKGYIIGETRDGDVIVQVQGNSSIVPVSEVKEVNKKPEAMKPQYKFDKLTQQNLTTKTLFEQYVKCGVFMNNTPIKTSDCYTMFNEWQNAKDGDQIDVLIEGSHTIMPKEQVRILDDPNEFANPDDYIEGVMVSNDEENSELNGIRDEITLVDGVEQVKDAIEAVENILLHAGDFTGCTGEADEVRIIRGDAENQKFGSAPRGSLRTLSV